MDLECGQRFRRKVPYAEDRPALEAMSVASTGAPLDSAPDWFFAVVDTAYGRGAYPVTWESRARWMLSVLVDDDVRQAALSAYNLGGWRAVEALLGGP